MEPSSTTIQVHSRPIYFRPNKRRKIYQPLQEMTAAEILEEIKNMQVKQPMEYLHLLLNRRGVEPLFDCIQVGGPHHRMAFKFRVSFLNYSANGCGTTKQEAKHIAAKKVLDIILKNPVNDDDDKILATVDTTGANNGNPISWLQEYCTLKHWTLPAYREEIQENPKVFKIVCTLHEQAEIGEGPSKKIAKRIAATKMYTKAQNNPELFEKIETK